MRQSKEMILGKRLAKDWLLGKFLPHEVIKQDGEMTHREFP